jgi:hypothetical protein
MTYWGRCNFFNSLLKLEVKRMKFSEKLNSYFNALHFLQREKLPYGSIFVPNTFKNFASHSGWAGQAGAVTRLPST